MLWQEWSQQGLNAMGKLVADIIVDTLQSAGVKHCYGIVGDTRKSEIEWVSVRHEEAGAFAAQAEAQVADRLTAVAGSCGPGSLHFINGIFEANRNRAPVILIASQIIRDELGFDFIQEVDFKQVYRDCSVFCDMIHTPEQARRKTVIACQTALAKRGVAVLIVPADISASVVDDSVRYAVHVARPVTRPNDGDLAEIAEILNKSENVVLYGGSGCQGAHQEILAVANELKAPIAHTSRAKDFLEYDNPYNIGMTGMLGNEAGYHALLDCDALLMLGADFAWRQFYPDKAKIVQVDIDPTHLGRRHPITKGVVGDVKATMASLLPMLVERTDASFRSAYVKRYAKYRESERAKSRCRPRWQHSRNLSDTGDQPPRGKRCVVHGGRRYPGRLGLSPYRGERSAPHFRKSASWNDGQRHAVSHWTPKGRTRSTSRVHGGRRWNFDAVRRPDDGRRTGVADQDCRL
jgi:pyruvate dehydrogenase (quinone)